MRGEIDERKANVERETERQGGKTEMWSGEEARALSAMLRSVAAVAAVIFVTIEECNIVTPSDKSCLRIAV